MDLDISGMTCDGCATHVKTALETVPGVTQADVWYPKAVAHVAGTASVKAQAPIEAVKHAGYGATPHAGSPGTLAPARSSLRAGRVALHVAIIGSGGAAP